jgi:hypothetical protein
MKVYQSKNIATATSIVITLIAVIGVVFTLIYFRSYWYFLFLFFTPLFLISLLLPDIMIAYYSVKDGYLIKQMDKKNTNDPWKTYTIDEHGKKDYKATIYKIKLSEIIRIEKRKNLFGNPFIAVYYSNNNAIDIYLKPKEMDEFIGEISAK